jgi:hypothetical protein
VGYTVYPDRLPLLLSNFLLDLKSVFAFFCAY